jgi:DNA repair exonuclease SbcCD ATPase subunit
MNLEAEQKVVDRIDSKLRFLRRSIKREKRCFKIAGRKVRRAIAAQQILQSVAQIVQQNAHERIAKVVSSCLSSVFDNPYEFRINFTRKRGRTEADIVFVRDGKEVDPITASGGGMIDVAAFALRVVCLVLHRPRVRPVVVLDEPFKFVSSGYQENVRLMLEKLSKEMKVQIIMVSHIDELETGKIIRL